MGLVLDAAVVLLAIGVCGSLGLLAWTLAVNGRDAVRTELARVAQTRSDLAAAGRRLRDRSAATEAVLRQANERLRPKGDS